MKIYKRYVSLILIATMIIPVLINNISYADEDMQILSASERIKKAVESDEKQRIIVGNIGRINGVAALIIGLNNMFDSLNKGSGYWMGGFTGIFLGGMGILTSIFTFGFSNKICNRPKGIENDYKIMLSIASSNEAEIASINSFAEQSLSLRAKEEREERIFTALQLLITSLFAIYGQLPANGIVNIGISGYLLLNKYDIEKEYDRWKD